MRKKLSKVMALICVATITVTSMPYLSDSTKGATMDFSAENSSVMVDKGGYKKEVYGVGTDDWGVTWTDRKNNLPTRTTYLTDNYIHLHTAQQVMECRWHHRRLLVVHHM